MPRSQRTYLLEINCIICITREVSGQVISFLLAMGVGAGFAVSFELKSLLNDIFTAIAHADVPEIEESKANYDKFINRGIIATSLLSLGFVCMAVVSLLSSIGQTARKSLLG